MSVMQIEYELRGLDEAFARVRATKGRLGEQTRDIMREAGDRAYKEMQIGVPDSNLSDERVRFPNSPRKEARFLDYQREPHRKIRDSLAIQEIAFAPGGLGGGGFYEIEVGPIDDPPSHLASVMGGSSTYTKPGTRMGFQKGNFFRTRAGQEPQNEWVEDGIDAARFHIATEIQKLDLAGNL